MTCLFGGYAPGLACVCGLSVQCLVCCCWCWVVMYMGYDVFRVSC